MNKLFVGGLASVLLILAGGTGCTSTPAPAGPSATPWQSFDWAAASPGQPPEAADGVWAGIFQDKTPNDNAARQELEEFLGRKFAVQMWFTDFSTDFPTASAEAAWKAGTVPNITWEPWFWTDQEKIHLADINEGTWDDYITAWGKAAAAFGKPVFVRWGHEFNGNWYPWSVAKNGENPKTYIKAYRRVHNLVTAAGAANVIWVWCPNASSAPVQVWNAALLAYPGDQYVDWVALDGYDFDGNITFADLFARPYAEAVKGTEKPLYIGEFATGRTGADKAAWIADMHQTLKEKMPALKGLVWFDIKKERDWRLADSDASLDGAAAVFSQGLYRSSPASVARLAQDYPAHLAEYRAGAKALTAVVHRQVVLPRAQKAAGGGLDWSASATLPVVGTQGPAGSVNLAWDEKNLYLRLVNTKGTGPKNTQTDDVIWNGDGLEFCLSTNPEADSERGYFDTTDWQLGFSPGDGTPARGPRSWEWTKLKSQVPGALVTTAKTAAGWTLEATVPWTAFGTFAPRAGQVLGFDTAVDLVGPDGARGDQWIWNGNANFYNSPIQWGTLLLKD